MKTFNDFNIDVGNKSTGKIKTQCPKCSHTRKNKKDKCLSVDVDKGLFNCHNCGYGGTTKFEKKQDYIVPNPIKLDLSDAVIDWFKTRTHYLCTKAVFIPFVAFQMARVKVTND